MKLKDESDLDYSDIVANSAMNRKRKATGVNSYEKDLYFNPIKYLEQRLNHTESTNWLDVCCGEGNALIEAAQYLSSNYPNIPLELEGIDLVDFYSAIPPSIKNLKFYTEPIRNFRPQKKYDLITCVHGLHYVGDKLGAIQRLLYFLKPNGKFIANFDLNTVWDEAGQSIEDIVLKCWKKPAIDIQYDKKRKIVQREGYLDFNYGVDMIYFGADDQAGPNYTGQRAVDSFYRT